MTSPEARKVAVPAVDVSAVKAGAWLALTAFLALVVLYFVGMDQGATSVFGSNTYVHEFVPDPRARLAFPGTCPAGVANKMEKHIIGRGLVAGALAGVIAFVFAPIFVDP